MRMCVSLLLFQLVQVRDDMIVSRVDMVVKQSQYFIRRWSASNGASPWLIVKLSLSCIGQDNQESGASVGVYDMQEEETDSIEEM